MTYPAAIRTEAEAWTQGLRTQRSWTRDPARAFKAGEAQGFLARASGYPHAGYVKPTVRCAENAPRAANEKIAADLAAAVDITVPPVLLFDRPGEPEPRACVSLVMYTEQIEWDQLRNAPATVAPLVRASFARACGVIAFDTFLANPDRNNDRNAIFGSNPARPADDNFVFLDFSMIANFEGRWENGAWRNVSVAPIFDPLRHAVDPVVLGETIDRIESLSDKLISDAVDRIPDEFMSPDHRKVVIDGLMYRRHQIRPILAAEFSL